MRALSAGGNYSDYANSGFCSTPLPGGGLLPSPPLPHTHRLPAAAAVCAIFHA